VNEPSGTCPNSDWIQYGKNCYLFERITRSYGDAKFDCSTRSKMKRSLLFFIIKNLIYLKILQFYQLEVKMKWNS
jgi:hypothetical protein